MKTENLPRNERAKKVIKFIALFQAEREKSSLFQWKEYTFSKDNYSNAQKKSLLAVQFRSRVK